MWLKSITISKFTAWTVYKLLRKIFEIDQERKTQINGMILEIVSTLNATIFQLRVVITHNFNEANDMLDSDVFFAGNLRLALIIITFRDFL